MQIFFKDHRTAVIPGNTNRADNIGDNTAERTDWVDKIQ
jgi:hypothetical protein